MSGREAAMAFGLESGNTTTALEDFQNYNEDLKTNYFKYKQIFEDITKLTPQEHAFVEKHHLEDKLATINYDFWKHVNTIVTSYFDIIKLIQRKREIENEISRLWCSKLSTTYAVPKSNQNEIVSKTCSESFDAGPSSSVERLTMRAVPTIEDRVMRYKVASVFSGDLIKTIRRSIFSVRRDEVMPGSSNLKQLEKEAKWFRAHKRELEAEILKLNEHKNVLKEKINWTAPVENSSSGQSDKLKNLRNLFKYFRVMNFS